VRSISGRCRHTLADLFEHVPLPASVLHGIRRRMSAPRRHYHNLAHLADMWRQHQTRARGQLRTSRMERLIASAIVFHDSIYDTHRDDNEAASAALWQRFARGSRRLPRELIQQVCTAIESTAHHTDAVAGSARRDWVKWVVDLDLSPMGRSRHRVQANRAHLRSECPYLPAAAWEERLERFFTALQGRDRIFQSPYLAAVLEANVRLYVSDTLATLSGADRIVSPATP
jgi:predicted metal-dependent HD superfamily phosphohydrolase